MGLMQRMLIFYLFIAIAISFACPEAVFDGNNPREITLLSWFNIENTATGVNFDPSTSTGFSSSSQAVANNTLLAQTSPSSSGGILGWLDPLFQVFSWIPIIFKVLFSPLILLTSDQISMPGTIVMLIAVPMVVLFLWGLINWIRSGNG